MTRGEVKYYLKVIRKGYKNVSPPFVLTNFVILILVVLSVFFVVGL